MAKNTSIILGDHFDQFIQSEIKSGRYSSASEVLRTGLRLLEIEKQKITAINNALTVGEDSGKPKPFDNEKFKARMRKKHHLDA
jgi:antitoxin ParD1/3/4